MCSWPREKKNGMQSAKMVSECTICILFFENFSRESLFWGNFNQATLLQYRRLYSTEIGLHVRPRPIQRHPAMNLASRSITDNVHFGAILKKIQLSLSEFKRLDLHSRLHRFASFFQNFLGGGPPNPHLQEGRPLPYPPPLGPSGLERTLPTLASGPATVL